jgi:hypothetical protein
MRRLIILSVVLLGLHSCAFEDKNTKRHSPVKYLDKSSPNYDKQYEIYILDGCEYIVVGVGNTNWGSHKGDCKNPIHIHNGEVHTTN